MTTVNDVVLLYLEDAPVSFARVEQILPDPKKDWYQITLLMLQIPLQTVTWILKNEYINGLEFHMNGKKMRLERVEPHVDEAAAPEEPVPSPEKEPEKGNIISFSDLKKKHGPDPG
jgi:hypothetical protein